MKRVMTVAGSDSGGGAGIQADLKTFAAMRVYGTSAITALTAQNTMAVEGIHVVPPSFVAEQIDTVLKDISLDALKTGMLGSVKNVHIVSSKIKEHGIRIVVIDPVMVATSGDSLVDDSEEALCEAIKKELLPIATVVTPNIPEAEMLTGDSIRNLEDMKKACTKIHQYGVKNVIVKGGHLIQEDDSYDILFDGEEFYEYRDPRIKTTNTHGTGCTFASALAAALANGMTIYKALQVARQFVRNALITSVPIGHGHGPTNHFGILYSQADYAIEKGWNE